MSSPAPGPLFSPAHLGVSDLLTATCLAEACGRFEDMTAFAAEYARRRAAAGTPLTHLERQLLSVAYKNRFTGLRGTLKMCALVAEHEGDATHLEAVAEYTTKLQADVLALATELLTLIQGTLIPAAEDLLAHALAAKMGAGADEPASDAPAAAVAARSSAPPAQSVREVAEAIVFWFKLAADYCRYVAECHSDAAVKTRHSDNALSFYSKARQYASLYLHPASPALLGVVLNFTVFLFEIRQCEAEAADIATATLDEVAAYVGAKGAASKSGSATEPNSGVASADTGNETADFQPLTPEERRESEAVIALIRENIRVWSQVMNVAALVAP